MSAPNTRTSEGSRASIISMLVPLQNAQVKPAVNMQNLTRAVVQFPVCNGPDRRSNIRTLAHATLRQQTLRNAAVVICRNFCNHVGSYDPGLYLKHRNVVGRQARGKQL